MIDATLMAAVLDSLKDPVLFADTEHVTRYMNKDAIAYYDEGESLIGRSLLDCHNEQSQQQMDGDPGRYAGRGGGVAHNRPRGAPYLHAGSAWRRQSGCGLL